MVGAVLLVVPALRRLTPPGTFRARAGLPATVLIRGLLTFAFFAGDAYVPLTLTSIRHTITDVRRGHPDRLDHGLDGRILGAGPGHPAPARPGGLIAIGLALVLAGLVAMASLLWPAVPVWIALVAWTVAGFGIGLAYSPISLTALGWARPGEEGRVSASVQLCDVLGTALGTGVAGAAVAIVHQHGGPIPGSASGLAFAVAVAVVGLLALAVTPRLPSPRRPEAARRLPPSPGDRGRCAGDCRW